MKAILFDLDGTLLDSAPDLATALNRLLEEHGRKAMPEAGIRNHVSQGSAALVKLGFGDTQKSAAFEALRERFLALYAARLHERTRPFPGIPPMLDRIESLKLPWGIVTNKPGWLTEPLLKRLALFDRAGAVVSGDTTPHRKPHPAPLFHAAATLGIPARECLYVGDDPRDIQAGQAAGMTTLVAGYGYIDPGVQPTSWGADGVIDSPSALTEWLIQSSALDRSA